MEGLSTGLQTSSTALQVLIRCLCLPACLPFCLSLIPTFSRSSHHDFLTGYPGKLGIQVCVADALYMLLGVTPVNKGTEVLWILEMWRDKQLSLGSSIHAEVMYMAANVWEPDRKSVV